MEITAYKNERTRLLHRFGANVRSLRAATTPPLSQELLADRAGLHRTEICRIETGCIEPRLTTLVLLAHALEVKLDDLIAGLPVPVERRPSRHGPLAEVARRKAS